MKGANKWGRCRGCGKTIVWVRTVTGKNMPCDPQLTLYWEKEKAPGKVVTMDGRVVSCEFSGEPDKVSGYGYISHYATCPQAKRFKRK